MKLDQIKEVFGKKGMTLTEQFTSSTQLSLGYNVENKHGEIVGERYRSVKSLQREAIRMMKKNKK